jgi:hypothetical protein
MKRVVRNTDTNMFIRSDGQETKSIDMARAFISYDDAVAFCKANHLTTVELVVQRDDHTEFTVAVPPKRLAPAH